MVLLLVLLLVADLSPRGQRNLMALHRSGFLDGKNTGEIMNKLFFIIHVTGDQKKNLSNERKFCMYGVKN